jgi:hypothetical protein
LVNVEARLPGKADPASLYVSQVGYQMEEPWSAWPVVDKQEVSRANNFFPAAGKLRRGRNVSENWRKLFAQTGVNVS